MLDNQQDEELERLSLESQPMTSSRELKSLAVEYEFAKLKDGYRQHHTEQNLSGLRSPLIGNVCFGEWEKTGPDLYRMNHFGISYDPTGQKLVGPARIQQTLHLEDGGLKTSGTFTIDQYDETGKSLAHLEGTIRGSRVTMDTGFERVE